MNRISTILASITLLCVMYSPKTFAQPCPYEPLGSLNGETAVCTLAVYRFEQGGEVQQLEDSTSATGYTVFDGLTLFNDQNPQPANLTPPFRSSSEIIVLGSSDSASGVRVEHRGRGELAAINDSTAFFQTIAYESHARVTLTPQLPDSASTEQVNFTLDFVQNVRLTDDAAGGGDTGAANVGATVLIRDANEMNLADNISGSAFLNVDNGENPFLWNAFDQGGTATSCGDGCQDVSVRVQRQAMVPVNKPVSIDAFTFGVADHYAADQEGTTYSADNMNTAVISISSSNPEVRFVVTGNLPTVEINAGMNDAWYNPATSGQGFLMSVFPDIKQLFVAWFTYDTERPADDITAILGDPGHRWLTAQGPFEGNTANLTVFVTEGGVFDAANPAASTDPAGDGTMTVTFKDCESGIVSYEIASLGLSGEVPIQRIVNDNAALCETLNAPEA